jgi:hypothetical protein
MKVFISWPGPQSKRLGEAFRDWLPSVIQLVTPYFTPADIEKGTRWSTDISRELVESQVGIICITKENIHSDWILFEAGALSKSLEKSHVCPILFGISNADLAGPLKQFQTTEFEKGDMHKLLSVINSRLGENKLLQKTLDNVFDKWWPDLEIKIREILSESEDSDIPIRSDRDLLEEILLLSRISSDKSQRPNISHRAIQDLLVHYIALHNEQMEEQGSYQETLDSLKKMHKAFVFISDKYKGTSGELDSLIEQLNNLSYKVQGPNQNPDDDIPF